MKCIDCKYHKKREQDGGIKALCAAFGEEIGSGQSITDAETYPLKYHRNITACECYAPKKTDDGITYQAIQKVFVRDEPNRQGQDAITKPQHPFGG